MRYLAAWLLGLVLACSAQAQQVSKPQTTEIDITKPPYNAKADGAVAAGVVSGTDNTAAFNMAYQKCAVAGCVITAVGTFAVKGKVTGGSNTMIRGSHMPGFGTGSEILLSGATATFDFPVGANAWGFEHVKLNCNNSGAPAIKTNAPASGTTFGGFNGHLNRITIVNCAPAIDSNFAFDMWVTDSVFKNNGIVPGTGHQNGTIYIANGPSTTVPQGSNTWHIMNNLIETGKGRGIVFDGTGGSTQNNGYNFVTNNHCEGDHSVPDGNACLYVKGGHDYLMALGNLFMGTKTEPLINLGAGGTGNILKDNVINGAGFYNPTPVPTIAVVDGNFADSLSTNTFVMVAGSPAAVNLTAASGRVTVTGNKSIGPMVPTVGNNGVLNQVYANDYGFSTPYTPALTYSGGSAVTSVAPTGFYELRGNSLRLDGTSFGTNYTTAPTGITLSLPAGLTTQYNTACFGGTNGALNKAVMGVAPPGVSTLSLVDAAGAMPLTASGQVIVLNCEIKVSY